MRFRISKARWLFQILSNILFKYVEIQHLMKWILSKSVKKSPHVLSSCLSKTSETKTLKGSVLTHRGNTPRQKEDISHQNRRPSNQRNQVRYWELKFAWRMGLTGRFLVPPISDVPLPGRPILHPETEPEGQSGDGVAVGHGVWRESWEGVPASRCLVQSACRVLPRPHPSLPPSTQPCSRSQRGRTYQEHKDDGALIDVVHQVTRLLAKPASARMRGL